MNSFEKYIRQFEWGPEGSENDLAKIMGVGQVTLENYLCGYVRPSKFALQRLLEHIATPKEEPSPLPLSTVPLDSREKQSSTIGRFATIVKDDRLSSVRIFSGNLAVIYSTTQKRNGDILCVGIDGGESRLMRYSSDGETARLFNDQEELLIPEKDFSSRVKSAGRLVTIFEAMENEE